jgi:hypothetical protein
MKPKGKGSLHIPLTAHRSRAMRLLICLVAFIVGVASPFALGDTNAGTSTTKLRPSSSESPLFQKPRSVARQMASAIPSTAKQSRSSIQKFISGLNPLGGKKDGRWKGGESKATIPARLLFSYINPLLDLAAERNLDANDSFDVAEEFKMNYSVNKLTETYERVKKKGQKKIEEQKQQPGKEKLKQSQSMLLLKALVQNQQSVLVATGVMRLCNTAIQAFPAVLVSRLLRLIEAGEAYPASKSFTAAITLVSLLTLKMVTENQYFHTVVNMSTQTRGALEGLIFDKSLRLPGGGSGVLSQEKERKALGSGGVLNLMQSDASIIESATMQVHTLWDGPLQVGAIAGLNVRPFFTFHGFHNLTIPSFSLRLSYIHIFYTNTWVPASSGVLVS